MKLNPNRDSFEYPALVSGATEYSYHEFWEMVNSFAGTLHRFSGVRSGEMVPLVGHQTEVTLFTALGLMKLGALACPLNPRWPRGQLQAVARRLNPKRRPELENSLVAPAQSAPTSAMELYPFDGRRVDEFYASLSLGLELDSGSGRLVVHTSGSVGDPKGAVLSGRNVMSAAARSNESIALCPGDRWLLSLPPYHVGGLSIAFRCLAAGATIALPEEGEALGISLTRYAPSHVSLVATQLYRLLREETSMAALVKCKAVVMGGGPTPEGLVRDAVGRGIPLVMSYGMTETAAMICCTRPGDPVERLFSSGRPLVEGTVSISSEGELLVRGDQLFLGYLQPDGSLQRPLTADGRFRTGDLGYFDNDGYLHVTGRRDNMFISGGENIQPEEIEAALRESDGVEEAMVVPVEDAEWGRRPVAFVRTRGDLPIDADALRTSLRAVLPGYKVPRTIHAWPADLVQPGVKPSRREFQKLADNLAAS